MKKRWEAPALSKYDKSVLDAALEMIRLAIVRGRDESKSKGIHAVFSGLNGVLKNQFPGCNPAAITHALAEAGKLVLIPRKGGPMVYLPEEAPAANVAGSTLLAKMGLKPKPPQAGNTIAL